MKEKDKSPEELNEENLGHVPNKEFGVMIVKMIKELRRRWINRARIRSFNS